LSARRLTTTLAVQQAEPQTLIPEAETEKQKPEGHTMTEQNLTADPDDTEGHGMAHGRDEDDTEGH
jgi:hypothetical protein